MMSSACLMSFAALLMYTGCERDKVMRVLTLIFLPRRRELPLLSAESLFKRDILTSMTALTSFYSFVVRFNSLQTLS